MAKILLDITHPAHVHFFKHAIQEWQRQGHKILITSRDKDLTLHLLNQYKLCHTPLSQAKGGVIGWGFEMLRRTLLLWRIIHRERPAVLTGIGGTFIAPVGRLTGIPVVIFTDTEHAMLSNAITFPLVDVICTPSCYENHIGHKQIRYAGYQELAYLHPNRFMPDPTKLQPFGVSPTEPYILMRLVRWTSGHDIGDRGFTDLASAVETLSHYGKVLISSERALPPELSHHGVTISPDQIHHLLAFAKLYIGESATMASESAILGVPAIFVSTSTRGYTNEQGGKYGLVYTFSNPQTAQEESLKRATILLETPNLRAEWQAKRERMLSDMIDVTAFVVDVINRYTH